MLTFSIIFFSGGKVELNAHLLFTMSAHSLLQNYNKQNCNCIKRFFPSPALEISPQPQNFRTCLFNDVQCLFDGEIEF